MRYGRSLRGVHVIFNPAGERHVPQAFALLPNANGDARAGVHAVQALRRRVVPPEMERTAVEWSGDGKGAIE